MSRSRTVPTKTVLTALGGVAAATGLASTAEARPICECVPAAGPTAAPSAHPETTTPQETPDRPKPRTVQPAPARDVGTATSAEHQASAQNRPEPVAQPKPVAEPKPSPEPAPAPDPGAANSNEGPIQVGVQAQKPAGQEPLTPQQRSDRDGYVRTLDQIKADGDALRPSTAQALRRFGSDPAVTDAAHKVITARDRKDRLDHGGVEADPNSKAYTVSEQGFDDTSTRNVTAMQRTYPRADPTDGLKGLERDHNRTTTPLPKDPVKNVPGAQGYGWNEGDNHVDYLTPQGIGGQDGEQVTSWYGKGENDGPDDVRIGFTNPSHTGYRFALAVKPKADGTYDRVGVHAGGAAQYGHYVYVPDTSKGLRVYDTQQISRVPHDKLGNSDNYKYLLPEVGSYQNTGKKLRYSTISIDRSNPAKPALVVGEYKVATKKSHPTTHVVRFDIDPVTGRLASGQASAAYVTKRDQVQGVAMDHGRIYLSSSQSSTGRLYHGRPGGTIHDTPWSSSPESLYVDGGRLWSLSEKAGERSVFSVPLPRD